MYQKSHQIYGIIITRIRRTPKVSSFFSRCVYSVSVHLSGVKWRWGLTQKMIPIQNSLISPDFKYYPGLLDLEMPSWTRQWLLLSANLGKKGASTSPIHLFDGQGPNHGIGRTLFPTNTSQSRTNVSSASLAVRRDKHLRRRCIWNIQVVSPRRQSPIMPASPFRCPGFTHAHSMNWRCGVWGLQILASFHDGEKQGWVWSVWSIGHARAEGGPDEGRPILSDTQLPLRQFEEKVMRGE